MKEMKTLALLVAALAMTMVSCSNDSNGVDDDVTPPVYEEPVGNGDDVQPVVVGDEVAAFFDAELPFEQKGSRECNFDFEGAGTVYVQPENQTTGGESRCVVINSMDELRAAYHGERALPEIDFSSQTLIIGVKDMWMLASELVSKELVVADEGYEMQIRAIHDLDHVYPCVVKYLYFWGLYPKLADKPVMVNLMMEVTDSSLADFIGSWEVTKAWLPWTGTHTYAPGDVVYEFRTDGTLAISAVADAFSWLGPGEYSCHNDAEGSCLVINDRVYGYQLEGDELRIDFDSAADGPIFTLRRVAE